MSTIVGDIAISVGADVGPLVRDLGRAQGSVNRFGNSASSAAGRGMRSFNLSATAMAGAVVAAAGAVAALTAASMKNIDALAKQARSLGLNISEFQKMALVAKEAGVEQGQLAQMLGQMQKAAENGSDALGRLGLSLSDIQGQSPDEQFARIADALDKVQDPAQKTTLAMELFGRSGRNAINMLSDYRAKVAEAAAFQERFGIAISQTAGEQVERANDAVGRLREAFGGLGNTLAVAVAPAIEAFANGLINASIELFNLRTEAGKFQREMIDTFAGVNMDIREVVFSLERFRDAMIVAGNEGAGQAIQSIIDAMQRAQAEIDGGTISLEVFRAKMGEAKDESDRLIASLSSVEQSQFTGVIGRLGQLWGALNVAADEAARLNAEMNPYAGLEIVDSPVSVHGFEADPNAPRKRPMRPGVDSFPASGGRRGGGGGSGDALKERLARMQEEFMSESELLQKQFEERMKQIEEFRQAKLLSEQEFNDLELQMKEEHERALAGTEAKFRADRLRDAGEYFGALASVAAAGGEKMVKAAAVFSAAQATINAYAAASEMLKDPSFTGRPGARFAAAGAVLASGLKMVSAIKGVGNGGGSAGGASSGASSGAGQAPVQTMNFTISNDPFGFGERVVRQIAAQLNEAGRNGMNLRATVS
ncbi:MAG: hypothetical protein ACK4GO_17190 [Gemmobacter sp.]